MKLLKCSRMTSEAARLVLASPAADSQRRPTMSCPNKPTRPPRIKRHPERRNLGHTRCQLGSCTFGRESDLLSRGSSTVHRLAALMPNQQESRRRTKAAVWTWNQANLRTSGKSKLVRNLEVLHFCFIPGRGS